MRCAALVALSLLCASVGVGHAQAEPIPEAPSAGDATAAEPADLGALPEPEPASADALTDAELASLGLVSRDTALDRNFHFFGFADFTSFLPIKHRGLTTLGLAKVHSFYVGNVNLYLKKNLSENFRTLGEVRFTYLPNGALQANTTSFNVTSTLVTDYVDNSRTVSWGGVIMQRLYLEWTLHHAVTVRGGQFLTPYGVWNVDHGSPAYIPVTRPYAINSNYFPERQTGLEVLGRMDLSTRATLGYHLTLSNGGGPVSEYRDFDKNKAVGGRLYLEHHGAGFFRIGASGYYGRDTITVPTVSVGASSLDVRETPRSQYDALSFAADVMYKVRGLHLQAEWVSQQRRFTEEGRLAHQLYFAPVPAGFSSDFFCWAGYLLAAYELPWYALTPYVLGQHSREVLLSALSDYVLDVWLAQFGLNIHPIDEVVFKAEFARGWFVNGGPVLKYPLTFIQMQAAWAF